MWSNISSTASKYSMRGQTGSGGAGAPYFVIEPKRTICKSGESINFTAQCEGEPLPKVYWTFNGMKIRDDGTKTHIGAIRGKRTLDIKNCTVGDSGEYSCVAQNTKGQAVVKFSSQGPYVVGKLKPEVRLDGSVRLECSLAVNAGIEKVQWLKDGVPLRNADPKFSQASRGTSYVLQIQKVTTQDVGRYECKFTDKRGATSETSHALSEATCRKVQKLG